MRRRDFMILLAGTAAIRPFAARAQQLDRVRRIGVLVGLAEDDPETKPRFSKLQQGLERLGWSESRNIHIDYRFAPAGAQVQERAQELIALQSDVILAHTTPVTAALQRETRTIPIVFVNVSDPVGAGFIESLARPGGNLTGLLQYEAGIFGKWLAMLKEIAPRVARVALLANPNLAGYEYLVRSAEAAAPSLAIEVLRSPVANAADIERSIESFARVPDSGLVLPPESTTILYRDLVIALAARHRLPAVYSARFWVTAGGLMSYGTDQIDLFEHAASYVDRILRGVDPTQLPVQAPTRYETTLNLKTAKALGLEVPASLLVRADEVIE
jgi:putative tryptophan/tyrosine transport system substrate-binding protein